ncbi:MAG: HK97 gp10 family phage protein [Bacillota bacterium]|nr:HK97 gp10 family phage protein [Bacillota bacterium]
MTGLKIQGLEEFQQKLKTIEKKAPDRILNKLDSEGNALIRAVRANTPQGPTGNLKKGYRLTQVEKIQGGYQKGLYTRAPHFHLVEKGHRKVTPSGKEIGWTPGVFMLERTMNEREEQTVESLRHWLDELFEELSR